MEDDNNKSDGFSLLDASAREVFTKRTVVALMASSVAGAVLYASGLVNSGGYVDVAAAAAGSILGRVEVREEVATSRKSRFSLLHDVKSEDQKDTGINISRARPFFVGDVVGSALLMVPVMGLAFELKDFLNEPVDIKSAFMTAATFAIGNVAGYLLERRSIRRQGPGIKKIAKVFE